jgi:hypothetical protein
MKCLKPNNVISKPKYEVADIFRNNIYKINKMSPEQWQAITDIINCRTKKLGGHTLICNKCGHMEISYNSCRNRNCPKCQGLKKVKWLMDREKEILPINYFHVIFTIPHQLNQLTYQNRKIIYNLMFDCVKETLLEASNNPRNLGAKIGYIGIMHTWGQTLSYHPHIHCIVTGGGVTEDDKWKDSRDDYFIPVKILSILFKNKMVCKIREEYKNNKLILLNDLEKYKVYEVFNEYLDEMYNKNWMIYSKPPFSSNKNVFEYISRYTHRIAIANSRIMDLNDEKIKFRYKDYSDESKIKIMELTNVEFMRRFVMHIIPKRFMRIRFGGIFSNRYRKENIKKVKDLLNVKDKEEGKPINWKKMLYKISGINVEKCSVCKKGIMIDEYKNTG